jgi:hypothetical protein
MKKTIKKLFDPGFYVRLPSIIKYRLVRLYHEKILFKFLSKESVFTSIWRNNYWGNAESLSGPGSTLIQTEELRKKIPIMCREYEIKSVFDAPCGDLNWMRSLLGNAEFKYIGGDIVKGIIEKNNVNFQKDNINFIQCDITVDPFPEADLWLCRAVLYHLSNSDILLSLERFLESNVKYILTSNCITNNEHINKDIVTGDYRALNLMLAPFNFPTEVLWELDDFVYPHPPIKICLWSRDQIADAMSELRKKYK